MFGNAKLSYDQLRTCLSSVESVVNDRPLRVFTDDQNDLISLTPAMFLHGIRVASFPESMLVESKDVSREYQKRKTIQSELCGRFCNEYLALLVQRA